ncbi:hypothetical protein ElyMa_004805400 [Elysia marginata]|uniref:Secreted protein n=1 Tax=Elysia marginata TaxID=1093978 RepID=A0AAV4IEM0_9GAST|nr:hypothetical protein ElyMa_004805400 [Elysia marginata]
MNCLLKNFFTMTVSSSLQVYANSYLSRHTPVIQELYVSRGFSDSLTGGHAKIMTSKPSSNTARDVKAATSPLPQRTSLRCLFRHLTHHGRNSP